VTVTVGGIGTRDGSTAGVALVIGSTGAAGGASVADRAGARAAAHESSGDSSGVTRAVRSDCAGDGGAARVASVICGAGGAFSAGEADGTSARAAVDQVSRNSDGVAVAVSGIGAGDGDACGVSGVVSSARIAGGTGVASGTGASAAGRGHTGNAGSVAVTVTGRIARHGNNEVDHVRLADGQLDLRDSTSWTGILISSVVRMFLLLPDGVVEFHCIVLTIKEALPSHAVVGPLQTVPVTPCPGDVDRMVTRDGLPGSLRVQHGVGGLLPDLLLAWEILGVLKFERQLTIRIAEGFKLVEDAEVLVGWV